MKHEHLVHNGEFGGKTLLKVTYEDQGGIVELLLWDSEKGTELSIETSPRETLSLSHVLSIAGRDSREKGLRDV